MGFPSPLESEAGGSSQRRCNRRDWQCGCRAKIRLMAWAQPVRLTSATYQIHKGFTQFSRRMVIHEVRERLHGLSADILFLQEVLGTHNRHQHRYREWPGELQHGVSADVVLREEVLGTHNRHQHRYREWPGKPQHEFIADAKWHEVAYGKNAVYRDGHHGNAVLSRFPIIGQDTCAVSAHLFESRGLLHCEIKLGARMPVLHCLNVDLGLFERGRQRQIAWLVDRIKTTVPKTAPLIIAGDFNDWRSKGDRALTDAV